MRRALPLLLAVLISGCAIKKIVEPVRGADIILLCIERKETVQMAGFLPTMKSHIDAKGVPTTVYSGDKPEGCSHILRYNATWRWKWAMYLQTAEMRVYDKDERQIGMVQYGAGSATTGKYGSTESKVAPLIDQLFPPAD